MLEKIYSFDKNGSIYLSKKLQYVLGFIFALALFSGTITKNNQILNASVVNILMLIAITILACAVVYIIHKQE